MKKTLINRFALAGSALVWVGILAGCASPSHGTGSEAEVRTAVAPDARETAPHPEDVSPPPAAVPGGFVPSYECPGEPYRYAYSIYRSAPEKPSGVFVYRGLVFVIVNIDCRKENLRFLKGTAMLRAKAMLDKKYRLPSKYKLENRQMECRKYRDSGIFRYALAFRESDVKHLAGQ